MDQLIHLPEFRVIICRKCKYAVLPSHLHSHFTPDRPHGFTKVARQRIVEKVAEIGGLIQDEEELKQCKFPFPADTSEPIAALDAPNTDYLRCTFEIEGGSMCPHVCKTVKKVQEHNRKEHGWKSTNKGGRPKKDAPKVSPEVPWRGGVLCQRFFKQGPKSGFFEVGRGRMSREADAQSQGSQWMKVEGMIDTGMERVEDLLRRKIQATDGSKEPNPWLRRTGWARHLGGLDREELRALVAPLEQEGEAELRVIHRAFQLLIREAQKNAVTDVVGQAALFEAHRKEAGTKAKKPFNSRMDKTTFREYTRCWNQLLSYIVRADDLEEEKRPKFSMTSQQEAAFDELMDTVDEVVEAGEEEEGLTRVRVRLLPFCIALLDHDLADHQYKSVIISGLAVLGLQEGGRWANPEDFTPKLSAVIKLARLMVIETAYQTRQVSISQNMAQGMSQSDAETSAPMHVKLVQGMTRKFMMLMGEDGNPTPMDWMLDTRTYGLHIRYSTPAEGTVSWDGETILYQEIRFSMEKIRGMVLGLVSEARRQLIGDLLLLELDQHGEVKGQRLAVIDWSNMADNVTEQQLGWSFLKDSRNRFEIDGIDGRKWLARRVVEEEELGFVRRGGQGDQSVPWEKETIQQYQRNMEGFQEKLLILTHLVGGQAARAPEIIGIRHRNTTNGGVRNIFVDQGLVMFVTAYHKGYEFSERTKLIQRFLPREVGELMVYYLWLVVPFWETIQVVVDRVVELSAFVWGDAKTGEEDEEQGQEGEEDRGEDQGLCRPPRRWTSERMRRIMQRESTKWIGETLNISAWRQIAIAIARRFLRENFSVDEDQHGGDEDFDEDNHGGDSVWDLQAGHGTRIAGLIYARLLSEGRFETKSQRERFRQVSQEWHQFLGFSSSREGVGLQVGQKRKVPHWDAANREMRLFRWKKMRQVNIYSRLEALQGAGARFRGTQEATINAIMMGHSPVVMIAGTGTGKTMAIMLPASSVSGGTTIVVVPLCALQENLHERCEKARISSVIWSSQRPHESASIVFVTPESAVTKTFAGFMNRLQEMHRMDRIVFDECHTVLDGSAGFRPKLRELGKLALRGVQMVYLTATLPPREEDEFYRLIYTRAEDVKIFRGRTTRPNVGYQVRELEMEEDEVDVLGGGQREGVGRAIERAVLELVAEKLEQFPAPGKIIIYSSSVKGAESLGEALGCEVYHREVDNRDGKARRLKDWMDGRSCCDGVGEGRVIVATNALGLGIDVPDIRVVIHVGKVRRLKDYGQESGRAGRDGERSEAIIMLPTRDGQPIEAPTMNERGWVDIREFLQGNACRRVILDQVMDGRMSREACEEGEEQCDVCQEREKESRRQVARERIINRLGQEDDGIVDAEDSGFVGAGSEIGGLSQAVSAEELEFYTQEQQRAWAQHVVTEQRRQEGREVEMLAVFLERWKLHCPLCLVRGDESRGHHIQECLAEGADLVREGVEDLRKRIRFEPFSCCYYCHVPQAICQRWELGGDEGRWRKSSSQGCQFEGVVMEGVIGALHVAEKWVIGLIYDMAQEDGVDIKAGDDTPHKWLGRRLEWGGIEASRLVQVFWIVARKFGSDGTFGERV